MTLLVLGLVLFLGAHLLPITQPLRTRVLGALGARRYRALFSLASGAGLILLIVGKAQAPFVHVWQGWAPAFSLSHAVMPVALILLIAANMPTYTRRWLRHPMMIGVALWSAIHLAANGDMASVLLFGSFLVWSVVDLISTTIRGQTLERAGSRPSIRFDLIAVVIGAALFWLVARFHHVLFGPVVM